jgi:hypothetical protein
MAISGMNAGRFTTRNATTRARGLVAFVTMLAIAMVGLGVASSAAADAASVGTQPLSQHTFVMLDSPAAHAMLMSAAAPPFILAQDALNLEEKDGYTTEYIFGMSKGIMRSTLVPALKPFILIFTVPLDLAFLPFAAIAGAL